MEDKDIVIEITDAGKNSEGSGGYIVYTIKTTRVCRAVLDPMPPEYIYLFRGGGGKLSCDER